MSPTTGHDGGDMEDHASIAHPVRDDRDEGTGERRATTYRLAFGREGLNFESLDFADPAPTNVQILFAAGIRATIEWAVIALLPGGGMEEINPERPFDLRGRGVERVVAFRTDRIYRARLLDRPLVWGRASITGTELLALAGTGEDEALFLDVPGGTDRHIGPSDVLDLGGAGVERILAGPKPEPGFEVAVLYNGLVQTVRVRPTDTAAALITAARPLFGHPGGDLILVDEAGRELAPGGTLGEQGVRAHSRLQLRPRVVQGG